MNPNLKGKTWHGVMVNYPPESKEETKMFIGRFKDERYHVLGYIPRSLKPYLTEAEESRGNLGVVTLPQGKKDLGELVEGEIFHFSPEEDSKKAYAVKYLRFA